MSTDNYDSENLKLKQEIIFERLENSTLKADNDRHRGALEDARDNLIGHVAPYAIELRHIIWTALAEENSALQDNPTEDRLNADTTPSIDGLRLLADISFELAECGTLSATTKELLAIASCGVPSTYDSNKGANGKVGLDE